MDIKNEGEKLIEAFDQMVESVSETMHEAEEALEPTIDEMIQSAQLLAGDIHKLTQEESDRLGNAFKRDFRKAYDVLNQQNKELKDWLSFDLTLVEDKFIELIARSADKAWLDFRNFENQNRHSDTYRSGEVCSAGTLSCKKCSNTIKLKKTSHIPPCPKCQHTKFDRVVS